MEQTALSIPHMLNDDYMLPMLWSVLPRYVYLSENTDSILLKAIIYHYRKHTTDMW